MSSLIASPNPIPVCDGTGYGVTRLTFDAGRPGNFEIRAGGPNGVLFAQVGPTGSVETGKWVGDGHLFYLKDSANGEVLASALVRVNCSPAITPTPTQTAVPGSSGSQVFGIDSKLVVIVGIAVAFFLFKD